jgi:hypothetical protein
LGRTLRQAAGPGRRRSSRNARSLARQLAVRGRGARLPDVKSEEAGADQRPLGPAPTDRSCGLSRPHRDRDRAGVGWRRPVSTLVLALGLGIAVLVTHNGSPTSRSPAVQPLPCPAVDAGCVPVANAAGVLDTPSGRYQAGGPGDVVVLGRWSCRSFALPAVLRPRTGQIWTFAAWPRPAQRVVGQLVAGHVAAAWSLKVLVERSGCDRIQVLRRNRPPLTMDAEPR